MAKVLCEGLVLRDLVFVRCVYLHDARDGSRGVCFQMGALLP